MDHMCVKGSMLSGETELSGRMPQAHPWTGTRLECTDANAENVSGSASVATLSYVTSAVLMSGTDTC